MRLCLGVVVCVLVCVCASVCVCVVEIHQNPINLSFKHFHFGSLRCASDRAKRKSKRDGGKEGEKESDSGW